VVSAVFGAAEAIQRTVLQRDWLMFRKNRLPQLAAGRAARYIANHKGGGSRQSDDDERNADGRSFHESSLVFLLIILLVVVIAKLLQK
jgi:hypothetical protein